MKKPLCSEMKRAAESRELSRVQQVLLGGGVIFGVMLLTCGIRLTLGMSGFVGEVLALFAGILSTPFFLEASFLLIGFVIVIGLNSYARERGGEEYVSREELEARER